MAIFFCFDKRDFCELDICSKCKFYNGNETRGIFGHEADDLFKNIFGEEYDFLRVRMLVKADREGRCWTLPIKSGDEVWFKNSDGEIISEVVDFAGATANTQSMAFDADDIDKTVFLTSEDAKIAQRKEQWTSGN